MNPITVLSLFDGMSCGRLALQRANIPVSQYFASEIDKHAIKVTQTNFPNTVQLGDVRNVSTNELPKIDLLLAGSPCQGFSFSGKQLNFEDPRSKLFFEFVRVLNEIRETNPNVLFLLENVKMKKEYRDIISSHVGVEPIEIDSALVSAQTRKRLYWTNIPNVTRPEDKEIVLADVLCNEDADFIWLPDSKLNNLELKKNYVQYDVSGKGYGSQDQRAYYPQKKHGSLVAGCSNKNKVYLTGRVRKLNRNECERLQTVPDNYTSSVSVPQGKSMLGNGWTVDVIAHILKGIKG